MRHTGFLAYKVLVEVPRFVGQNAAHIFNNLSKISTLNQRSDVTAKNVAAFSLPANSAIEAVVMFRGSMKVRFIFIIYNVIRLFTAVKAPFQDSSCVLAV